ncbi:hypothetical protein B0I35DRAFT_418479 [Stachybotrys elegans]|uniref:Uncharacterized protein n=1 Tax=Stachybotrys elegans TaxID=80388 RepID=A0A8K0T286_9HYPO|nr:hypothetical protein B0I35DRAFT_418479 [Stachybotrys elegans]
MGRIIWFNGFGWAGCAVDGASIIRCQPPGAQNNSSTRRACLYMLVSRQCLCVCGTVLYDSHHVPFLALHHSHS